MGNFKNLAGCKFGRWTVIRKSEKKPNEHDTRWLCECSCGKIKEVRASQLNNGRSKSCGCLRSELLRKEHFLHGQADTRLHIIWMGMRARCRNKKLKEYKHYGARGIKVCGEWETFANFYEWALENGYDDTLTIERIDVNKDYAPFNCKWIPKNKQIHNRRVTLKYKYQNEIKSLAEWCEEYNIPYQRGYQRMARGWSIEEILTIEKGKSKWQHRQNAKNL